MYLPFSFPKTRAVLPQSCILAPSLSSSFTTPKERTNMRHIVELCKRMNSWDKHALSMTVILPSRLFSLSVVLTRKKNKKKFDTQWYNVSSGWLHIL